MVVIRAVISWKLRDYRSLQLAKNKANRTHPICESNMEVSAKIGKENIYEQVQVCT